MIDNETVALALSGTVLGASAIVGLTIVGARALELGIDSAVTLGVGTGIGGIVSGVLSYLAALRKVKKR